MGRGKVELKRIEDKNSRQVTFSKRRGGLMKKARELAVLCDVELALIIFSTKGRLYDYSSGDSMAKVLERYQIHVDEEAAICKTVQESEMCDRQVTNPGSNLLEVIPRHLQLQEDIEQLNVAELTHLEKRLDAMLRPVKCRKEQLMKDTVKTLYEKEQQLRQENSAMEQELAKILNETDPIYEHTPLVLAQQEPNSGSPPFVPSTTLPFF